MFWATREAKIRYLTKKQRLKASLVLWLGLGKVMVGMYWDCSNIEINLLSTYHESFHMKPLTWFKKNTSLCYTNISPH